MNLDRTRVRRYLKEFDFESLFIDELGWDNYDTNLDVEIDGEIFILEAIAEKRGVVAFSCDCIPPYATRRKIDRRVTHSFREHFIIYVPTDKTEQVWQWVRREVGKPLASREHRYNIKQSGESLIQKLQTIAFSFEEEEDLTVVDVTSRVRAAFNVERATKKFYDRFKKERASFQKFLSGIPDDELERWYVSVMLNRLMFIYFIQKKGFLDGDHDYLRNRLALSQQRGKDHFYRDFLCPLFFEGFAKTADNRTQKIRTLLGDIPYLNGSIFQRHEVERLHGKKIQIPDSAFERLFDFFEQYQWHLDNRPLRDDREINPDVLGYIFEKYINQKQMGAYYTKEDITEYISKNTIIPYLFDTAQKKCRIAFEGEHSVWKILTDEPDRYIYDAVRKGTELDLPPEIEAGIDDVSQRGLWNTKTPEEYALPTEIWRETVRRRQRYEEVRKKLANGEVQSINDFITYNLDIHQFAQDVIGDCEGPELLRAFWKAINEVTVLDPTCGSGAFLFAALNILEPLYEACLERMEAFVDELTHGKHHPHKYIDFRSALDKVKRHPNESYFIFKSIVINNLYGVDIMPEAVEIAKLRLFLKLVSQVEGVENIEPLPDIDFNIRAGNTLVGYTTYDEVERAVTSKLDFEGTMKQIEEKAEDVDRLFSMFREMQTKHDMSDYTQDFIDTKEELRKRLKALEDELNRYLALEYGVNMSKPKEYQKWLASHQPFHWFIDFYGILQQGGFDVIIGNPPYVSYAKTRNQYHVLQEIYKTFRCVNLYAFITERIIQLIQSSGYFGVILPLSSTNANGNSTLQDKLHEVRILYVSHFAVRPSKLFVGVDMNLTIVCGSKKPSEETAHYTTPFYRWNSDFRPFLFPSIKYAKHNIAIKKSGFPKFGSELEISIWHKLSIVQSKINQYLVEKPATTLTFHSFGRYWRKCVREEYSNNYQKFQVPNRLAPIAICLLNSQLAYWYWIVISDCYRFTKTDALNIPIPLAEDPAYRILSKSLLNSYKENSIIQKKVARNGKVTFEKQFYPVKSKEIIDQIDALLAKHYGFTDEELDFIINYDIKYRMGDELLEEDEESTPATISEVNVNKASTSKLAMLEGVGPKTAGLIISERPYQEVEDLLQVSGIGEKTLEKFRDKIVLE